MTENDALELYEIIKRGFWQDDLFLPKPEDKSRYEVLIELMAKESLRISRSEPS